MRERESKHGLRGLAGCTSARPALLCSYLRRTIRLTRPLCVLNNEGEETGVPQLILMGFQIFIDGYVLWNQIEKATLLNG